MMKPVINLGLALAGAAAIMVANDTAPNAGAPCAKATVTCAKACDKPCDVPGDKPCGKSCDKPCDKPCDNPGDCVKCPNGTWCCKDNGGQMRCQRLGENGKCVPCPPEDCKPGDCLERCKSGKCPKSATRVTTAKWAATGLWNVGAKSPCVTTAAKSPCATTGAGPAKCGSNPSCCSKAAATKKAD